MSITKQHFKLPPFTPIAPRPLEEDNQPLPPPTGVGVFYLQLGTEKPFDDEDIAKALQETNGLVSKASKLVGIGSNLIYSRISQSPYLRRVLDEIRNERVDLAESKLTEALGRGEPYAVTLTLKTLGKDRGYTERSELTGPDNSPLFDTDHIVVVEHGKFDKPKEEVIEGSVNEVPKLITDGEQHSDSSET
jgi:hypothetical protein